MAWVGWQLGMQGDQVKVIQDKLARKFSWARAMGVRVTGSYDAVTASAVAEFQRRVGLVVTGIADWATQSRLGAVSPPPAPRQKIAVFTLSGTFADMWSGYPADVARALDPAVFRWQPVYYGPRGIPAAFPMGPSAQSGEDELVRLLDVHSDMPYFVFISYSQGAIPASRVLRRIMSGDLQRFKPKMLAGVTFGNPLREKGHVFPGGADPGGYGLDPDRLAGTPVWWYDYAAAGDIYTCGAGNDDATNRKMTSIYQLVQGHAVLGEASLAKQILELAVNPLTEVPPTVKAIFSGLGFAVGRTGPHIEYHIRQAMPGVTYFDHAVGYLREVGRRVQLAA